MAKSELDGILPAALVLFVASPIMAIVTAKIAAVLWTLTLAPQYGAGPSYQSWYGVSVLVNYISYRGSNAYKKDEKASWTRMVLTSMLSNWFYGLTTLLMVGLTRFVFGWH